MDHRRRNINHLISPAGSESSSSLLLEPIQQQATPPLAMMNFSLNNSTFNINASTQIKNHQELDTFIVNLLKARDIHQNPSVHFPGSINLAKDGTILFNNEIWSKEDLICYCIDEALHLSCQIQNNNLQDERLLRVLSYFNLPSIKSYLWIFIARLILCQKSNHKSSVTIGEQLTKQIRPFLQEIIGYGYYTNVLQEKDILFYVNNLESFSIWKEIYLSEDTNRLEALKTHTRYKPWLIALKLSFNEIEKKEKDLFESDSEFCTHCISQVVSWLNHPSKKNLIRWIMEFLFRGEEFYETKKKFLFVQGKPNTGKTFFMDLLFNGSALIKKYMSMSHFSANKKGIYKLHALIFDDPGKASGAKENNLTAEFFLNATKSDGTALNFPIKYGFMSVSSAQLCLISNSGVDKMFPSYTLQAMRTRILEITFDDNEGGFFPLLIPTTQTYPFINHKMNSKQIQKALFQQEEEEEELNFQHEFEEEEEVMTDLKWKNLQEDFEEEEDILSPQVDTPKLNRDNMFYFLWAGILHHIKWTIECQKPELLDTLIPNKELRHQVLQTDSILHFLSQTTIKDLYHLMLLEK